MEACRRRLAEKNKKKAKAVEKRKLIELGVMEKDSGPDKRKLKNMKKVYYGAKVVVDLGFDDLMIPKVSLLPLPSLTPYRVEEKEMRIEEMMLMLSGE